MSLSALISASYALPESSLRQLGQAAEYVELPKGSILFTDDRVADSVYLLQRGLARAFARRLDREVTFWFSTEGDLLLSIRGYVEQARSYEIIELLEDSQLYRFNSRVLRELYATDLALANWGRVLTERLWLQTEQQLLARQFRTAAERYAELLAQRPQLLRRVSLGHIASYLGISQVTLSRVRATVK